MEKGRPPKDESSRLTWHTAFAGAIQVELIDYKDALQFHTEYQLTSEPLRIDCLIIKKAKDVVITKNIAAIFREWNIMEYKSPGDYISVKDFYKVSAYANLYASSTREVSIKGLTVSLVGSRYPEGLVKHLREEWGCTVEEREPGIYTVKGAVLPVQIIDTRRLPEEENLWLRSLSTRVDVAAYQRMDAEIGRMDKETVEKLRAYLRVVAGANPETAKEAISMNKREQALEKVFEEVGWIAKWEARGRAEGEARGKAEGQRELLSMLESGKTIAEAKRILGFTGN